MTTATRTVYHVFTEAIAGGIKPTIQTCWADFVCWETARRFADDPSYPAKSAIEWIVALEDLRWSLDEFAGDTKAQCLAGLDQAYEAFAKLDHSSELVHAIESWMADRQGQER